MKTKHSSLCLTAILATLSVSCSNGIITNETATSNVVSEEQLQSEASTDFDTIDGLPVQVNAGNYITFDSLEVLSDTADLIIIAQPTNNLTESRRTTRSRSRRNSERIELNTSTVFTDDEGMIVDYQTVTPVRIKKVLKGSSDERIIGVVQRAAVVESAADPFIMTVEGFTPLEKNSKYILFLKAIDPSVFPEMAGMYSIISVNQGKFNLNQTDRREQEYGERNQQYGELKRKVRERYQSDFDSAQ